MSLIIRFFPFDLFSFVSEYIINSEYFSRKILENSSFSRTPNGFSLDMIYPWGSLNISGKIPNVKAPRPDIFADFVSSYSKPEGIFKRIQLEIELDPSAIHNFRTAGAVGVPGAKFGLTPQADLVASLMRCPDLLFFCGWSDHEHHIIKPGRHISSFENRGKYLFYFSGKDDEMSFEQSMLFCRNLCSNPALREYVNVAPLGERAPIERILNSVYQYDFLNAAEDADLSIGPFVERRMAGIM